MSLDAQLRVEFQPLNPPKPIQFAVIVDGKVVALISYSNVMAAVNEYNQMDYTYAFGDYK